MYFLEVQCIHSCPACTLLQVGRKRAVSQTSVFIVGVAAFWCALRHNLVTFRGGPHCMLCAEHQLVRTGSYSSRRQLQGSVKVRRSSLLYDFTVTPVLLRPDLNVVSSRKQFGVSSS